MWNPFVIILSQIIYRPILNLLIVFLILFWGNLGFAIIALTLAIRFLLLKTSIAQNDMQKQMWDIHPKLQEIQEKYKDNPEKMSQETMKILKTQWAGPLKWCLMSLVQIPVFLWLFWVVRDFSLWHIAPEWIYSFLSMFWLNYLQVWNINHFFLWMDMLKWWAENPGNIILAVVCWLLVYIQLQFAMLNKPATPQMPWGQAMPDMGKIMWFMNIFLIVSMWMFVYQMQAGIGLYILTTTVFSLVQSTWQYRELLKIKINTFLKRPMVVKKP